MSDGGFPILSPDLQVSFAEVLVAMKELYLHRAMRDTVREIELDLIDSQLHEFVPMKALRILASEGLRGELIFSLPCLLSHNPFLLGYYRLLLGFSQKEFYNKGPFGCFKRMEEKGKLSKASESQIVELCRSLIGSSVQFLEQVPGITLEMIHELQLLTLGPQLRGGRNTRIGLEATQTVYRVIRGIIEPYLKDETSRRMTIVNDSDRTVTIEFYSEPDVQIIEKLPTVERLLVSIEIKGGADRSNIHNRLGEAEKSHQKAKEKGCFEFWTIVNVEIDEDTAKRDSPTTSHLFHLDELRHIEGIEYNKFKDILASMLGIKV